MRYNQKRQTSPVKGRNCGFLPHIFPNLGHLERSTPPKRHVFLEFLVENKAFHFSKRALHAGTAHNKWLKKALGNCHEARTVFRSSHQRCSVKKGSKKFHKFHRKIPM